MTPTDIEASAVFTAIWWVVAGVTVVSALLVVHLQDLVKAAMALIATFIGVAALFVMLNAEFLAVVQVLMRYGVPLKRLHAVGYGEARPIESNRTRAGRAKNRRTELSITKQ